MRSAFAISLGICFLLLNPKAEAWNKSGHIVSAAIAYADLKERRPDVLAKVIQLLTRHPYFESGWANKLSKVSSDDRDLYVLMLAARWSDDVRGTSQYDRPEWHYVNIPYFPGEISVEIPHGQGILKALHENYSIAEYASSDDKARAVAVSWIFHLIGDVHQPLHVTKLVTEQFPLPEGDRGGTRFYIRVKDRMAPISLHKFWDGLILGSDKFKAARDMATLLRNKPGFKRENFAEELTVRSFSEWAFASYVIAKDRTYLNGTLQGSKVQGEGPVLPNDYKDKAKQTAERQIVLSGFRISDIMVDLMGQ